MMVAGGPGFKGEHFSQHPILCLQQIESGLRRYNFPIQSRHISPIMRYDRCRGFHGVVAFLGDNFWHCCRIRTELHDTSDFNKILDSLQKTHPKTTIFAAPAASLYFSTLSEFNERTLQSSALSRNSAIVHSSKNKFDWLPKKARMY